MQVTNPSPLSVGVNQEWGKKNLAVTPNPLRITYENKAQGNSSSTTITKDSAQSLGKDDEIDEYSNAFFRYHRCENSFHHLPHLISFCTSGPEIAPSKLC